MDQLNSSKAKSVNPSNENLKNYNWTEANCGKFEYEPPALGLNIDVFIE